MNVIVILCTCEPLYISNFCMHMMRMKATENKSHNGHTVHFFIKPSQIRPGVLIQLAFNDLMHVISKHG
jgi:hypothetical protein